MDFSEVFGKLGLDWRMLLFNSINFFLFFLILKKFIFGKVGKAVHDRRRKVEESLKYAEEVDRIMGEAQNKADSIVAEANSRANSIITTSQTTSEEIVVESKLKAQKEIETMQQKAKDSIERERELMFDKLKKQTADVALTATEKIIREELDKNRDKEIINEYLDQLQISKDEK